MAARAKSGRAGRAGAQNGKDRADGLNRRGRLDGRGEPNRCGLCGGLDGSDGLNGRGLCDRQDVRDGRGGMQATGRAGAGRGKVGWVAFIGYTAILRAGSPKAPRELPPEGPGSRNPRGGRWNHIGFRRPTKGRIVRPLISGQLEIIFLSNFVRKMGLL